MRRSQRAVFPSQNHYQTTVKPPAQPPTEPTCDKITRLRPTTRPSQKFLHNKLRHSVTPHPPKTPPRHFDTPFSYSIAGDEVTSLYDRAMKELAGATNSELRFYALDAAAKQSFEAGKIDDARKYATELLTLAPGFKSDWNYGNAIQDGNLVLGRIAVKEGRIAEAKQYLLEAGKSPGSPQMDSFGPNMSLAKDLLEKGERDAVLQYFELCRKFWNMDRGQLNQWSQEVKAGKVPYFGANLLY